MFQLVIRYFKKIANSNHIPVWKSKELPDNSIKLPPASNNRLAPLLNHFNTEIRVTFDGSCLKYDFQS